ncbi:MAG: O-antigen ligase domain-containing protein [Betaproteobacteria bacterium]|nr:O-antigen ligase domain-containing protein [Betaproteobacteria bacterium]
MTRVLPVLMGLALVCTVLGPLRSDLPSWAWSWWLLAAVVALRVGPRTPLPVWTHRMGPAVAALLLACLIDAALCLWHGGDWDILRQDGKVLLALPVAWAVWGAVAVHGARGGAGGVASPAALREALGWAIGLQMGVAAAVAICWPRAWLPATPIPWATAVAMGMAVLAPMVAAPTHQGPDSRAWRFGLGLAVLAGVVAVVLSRSRAAWVILPWLGVLGVVFARQRISAAVAVAAVAVAGLGTGLWYDSLQPVQVERGMRLLDLVHELAQLGQPDAATSLGSRIVLWEAAWSSLWSHPWTGIGVSERIALVQQVLPPEQLPDVAPLVHVHHQFLNQAVDHGLPGLLASLLCAAAPFALAWRAAPGVMRWQCLGVGTVHVVGLMFNANMTHGTYAVNYALTLMAILWIQASTDTGQSPDA